MRREEIVTDYMNWMKSIVQDDRYSTVLYSNLFEYLYETTFTWMIAMDGNRAEDGIDLRYMFADDLDINRAEIADSLDYRECSVLEMMVALSMRCESNIMGDPNDEDHTGFWFWNMIQNLGLDGMSDGNFDLAYTDRTIKRFLDRQYSPDGAGGLFTVKKCQRDLRGVEIWYQLCWYLDEILYAS